MAEIDHVAEDVAYLTEVHAQMDKKSQADHEALLAELQSLISGTVEKNHAQNQKLEPNKLDAKKFYRTFWDLRRQIEELKAMNEGLKTENDVHQEEVKKLIEENLALKSRVEELEEEELEDKATTNEVLAFIKKLEGQPLELATNEVIAFMEKLMTKNDSRQKMKLKAKVNLLEAQMKARTHMLKIFKSRPEEMRKAASLLQVQTLNMHQTTFDERVEDEEIQEKAVVFVEGQEVTEDMVRR